MRLLLASILLGITIVSVTAQEKKEPKGRPKEPLRKPYTEYVTVRRYYAEPTGFINPDAHIQAYRGKDREGKEYIAVAMGALPTPGPKSQITDADGNVYEVEKTVRYEGKEGSPTVCYCKKVKDGKKPEPAKDEPPVKPAPHSRGRTKSQRIVSSR